MDRPADPAVSDGRDWYAVVLDGRCPDCGSDASVPARDDLPAALAVEAGRWSAFLLEPAGDLRRRPAPGVWSAIEYACHARDVAVVFDGRIRRALAEDRPEFGWWDHEAAAELEHYRDADPTVVAGQLTAAVDALSRCLAGLAAADWARQGTRRGTERFTVEGQARFVLHELRHHRTDAVASVG